MKRILIMSALVAVAWALAGSAPGQSAPVPGQEEQIDWPGLFGGNKAITKPKDDAVMGFSLPTTIREVRVSGGQRVEEGQLLVRGEDDEELAILEDQRLVAESDAPVLQAEKAYELAQLEFERMETAYAGEGATIQELDRARVTMQLRMYDLETARMQQAQARVRVDRAEARVARYRLAAPFSGVVDQVFGEPGRTVGEAEPVIRVVNTESLQADVPTPTDEQLKLDLKEGDPAWVLLVLAGDPVIAVGRVIEVGKVADAASGTIRVRVEAPNPEGWLAGLPCWARFTEPEGRLRQFIVGTEPGPEAGGDT